MTYKFEKAFTLAEVLITLAVIGVVAALTIPNLIIKYDKKQTITKLQKANSVLSQMMLQAYSDNGPASLFLNSHSEVTAEKTKEYFNTYWLPYFKAPKVSDNMELPYNEDQPYKQLNGTKAEMAIKTYYGGGRIYFTTQDNISYFITTMYWDYERDEDGNIISGKAKYGQTQDVYVDINGTRGPNIIGKDVFRFSTNFEENSVKPYCYNQTKAHINNNCDKNKTNTGICCSSKIINDGWQIKEDYPW